ncbi:MAG: cupin domain-containing protein [Actinomycetota bacterium]
MTDWFVRNAREMEWTENAMGAYCLLAADQFAINLNVLPKDAPMALYHFEPHQEGFLVLRGEATLRVGDETRALRAWDYVHLDPDVPHVITGASDEPALVLAVGSRVGGGRATYPEDPDPKAAYAAFGEQRVVESPL